jgi:hypothetical protein
MYKTFNYTLTLIVLYKTMHQYWAQQSRETYQSQRSGLYSNAALRTVYLSKEIQMFSHCKVFKQNIMLWTQTQAFSSLKNISSYIETSN